MAFTISFIWRKWQFRRPSHQLIRKSQDVGELQLKVHLVETSPSTDTAGMAGNTVSLVSSSLHLTPRAKSRSAKVHKRSLFGTPQPRASERALRISSSSHRFIQLSLSLSPRTARRQLGTRQPLPIDVRDAPDLACAFYSEGFRSRDNSQQNFH